MLKKFCLLVIVMILVSGSACAEDLHIGMQFIIHQKDSETAVTADALIREHEIMLISGLFPSYAFSFESEGASLTELADTDMAINLFTLPEKKEVITAFLQMMNAGTYEGFFAGDLFDNATLAAKGSIYPADFLSFLAGHVQPEKDQDIGIMNGSGNFPEVSKLSELLIKYNVYDNGKYISFYGSEGNKTVFTVSCDCSAPDILKAVTGYASGGKNYYWDSTMTLVSPNEIFYTSALLADTLKQGYRNAVKGTPVVTENWTLQLSEDQKDIAFSGMILPENNRKTVEIEGGFSVKNHPAILIKAGFRDWEESYYTLSLDMNESTVNTEGLKIIPLNKLSDFSEAQSAAAEITENGIPFLLKMIMSLPEEYQDYFLSLMN